MLPDAASLCSAILLGSLFSLVDSKSFIFVRIGKEQEWPK